MSKLTDKIFKSWKTTVLGAVIVLTPLAGMLIYPELITLPAISAFYGVVLTLVFSLKDD